LFGTLYFYRVYGQRISEQDIRIAKFKKMKKIFFILSLAAIAQFAISQEKSKVAPEDRPDMTWFNEAKLGIFIHWGIYSVNGISESWSFYNNQISYVDYMKQLDGFTARNYNPGKWAQLFKEAGARYAVLTTKHHDGVSLWDTKLTDLNVVKKSPAKRDLIGPYAEALRKENLKVGLYFSHLDWSHPDYPTVFNASMRNKWLTGEIKEKPKVYSWPQNGKENTEAWDRFIKFHRGQLQELSLNYKPDLFWFDGDWERDDEQWDMKKLRQDLRTWNGENVILNARMRGYGDYETPEQALPVIRPHGPWEFCMTINHAWGYQIPDIHYKPVGEIIRIFSEIIGMGGNLLLDIGPKPDGTIPEKQEYTLKELGKWIKKHEEAVYATVGGMKFGHYFGPTSFSKDSSTIYLYYFDSPRGEISVKGVRNNIKSIRVVGDNAGDILKYRRSGGASWLNIPGVIMIDLPLNKLDQYVTVIAIDLEGKPDIYHGSGGAIEVN
jgi:alpha-L-fucosidase